MRATCMICVDIIVQGQDVSATPCGHTFHAHCITEWIKVSKSCPQCRTKATERTLIKLFFETSDSEIETDPDTLQQQIDNLKFQLKLKEQEVKKHKEDAGNSKAQAVALREEFRARETIIVDKETTIRALKTQLLYVDSVVDKSKKMKEEVNELKGKLKLLQGLETVLNGTTEEVTLLVNGEAGGSSGVKNIATFCTVLKKELSRAVEKRTKMRSEMMVVMRKCKEAEKNAKSLKEEVDTLTISTRHLEQDNEGLANENTKLKAKIRALEQSIASPSDDVRSSALHRLLFESPAPALLKRLHSQLECDSVTPEVVRMRPSGITKESKEPTGQKEPDSGMTKLVDLVSPPPAKKPLSTSVHPLTDSCNIMKGGRGSYASLHAGPTTSQAWKDRQLVGDQVGYDGLGGHHRADEFPKPSPLMRQLPKKSKFLYKPVKGKGKTNKLTNYFENTFED
ncbi:E3 ubiquitin-protein ligase TRAIP-like [Scylla paramamosain]|uniref:E3 ubiquitin-protein ligase TRAIP-like n=1 Tax=Scylla paramamosain TaxID=85552 RepID=UPI0030832546